MFVVNQDRIINSFNLSLCHTIQVRKILDVCCWRGYDRSLIMQLVNANLSHIAWRYFLIKKRYKRKSFKRYKLLGINCDGSEWSRVSDMTVEFWLNRGHSYEESVDLTNKAKMRYSKPCSAEAREKISKHHREHIEDFSRKSKEAWESLPEEVSILRKESAKERLKHASLKRDMTRQSFSKEYWIGKGFSEDEAKSMVAARAVRNKEYFIKKYGVEDGEMAYESMLDKRRKAREAKSELELEAIRQKQVLNAHVGIYNEDTIIDIEWLNFYLLATGEGVKFGLTKHDDVYMRWPRSLNYTVVDFIRLPAKAALEIETWIKSEFSCVKNQTFNTTEFINKDVEAAITKIIERIKDVQINGNV